VPSRPQRLLQSGPTEGYTERDIDRMAQLQSLPSSGDRHRVIPLAKAGQDG